MWCCECGVAISDRTSSRQPPCYGNTCMKIEQHPIADIVYSKVGFRIGAACSLAGAGLFAYFFINALQQQRGWLHTSMCAFFGVMQVFFFWSTGEDIGNTERLGGRDAGLPHKPAATGLSLAKQT